MSRWLSFSFCLPAAGVIGGAPSVGGATDAPGSSALDVADRHLSCFLAWDVDCLLSDYAPDATVVTPGGPLQTREAIQGLSRFAFSEFLQARVGVRDDARERERGR